MCERGASAGLQCPYSGARFPLLVAVQQSAKTAQHRTFATPPTASTRRSRDDAISQSGKWQRLQDDATRTTQRREKQPFATKKNRRQIFW